MGPACEGVRRREDGPMVVPWWSHEYPIRILGKRSIVILLNHSRPLSLATILTVFR